MARLSAIAQLPLILDAAQQWKRKCLLAEGSIFSDSQLWTPLNLAALDQHFTQNPQAGDEKFLEKLQRQLEPTSESVKQLAAELLWLLFLFPSNVTGSTKRRNVMDVWA